MRVRHWVITAAITAATGTAKIAPRTPASFAPIRTDPRTATGWRPTASPINRGWTRFIRSGIEMPITTNAGNAAAGTKNTATTTGGAHEKNGPKNGIMCRTATVTTTSGRNGRWSAKQVMNAIAP